MVSNAAVIMDTQKTVGGLSSGRKTVMMTKKRIICTCLAANVRRSLPLAKSSTKKTVGPYRNSNV